MNYLQEESKAIIGVFNSLGIRVPQAQTDATHGGKHLRIDGKKLVDYTRMDYLGMGNSPDIRSLMKRKIDAYDLSCPASQAILKPGNIAKLEEAIADFHKTAATLIFTSGYSANVNIMQAIGLRSRSPHLLHYLKKAGPGPEIRQIPTVFVYDTNSHYSLIHGIRLSCKMAPRHCHALPFDTLKADSLHNTLVKAEKRFGRDAIRVIVSDTIVSSNGQLADVEKMYQLAVDFDCLLFLDEAHAIGAIGEKGAGVASVLLPDDADGSRLIIMGTLTKSCSQLGGYITSTDEIFIHALRFLCPQYIFSAPVLPWMAEVLVETLELIQGDWGQQLRRQLNETSEYLRSELAVRGFDTLDSTCHIVPVLIGEIEVCSSMRQELLNRGFNVSAFIFPAVPKNGSLLRISVCADITRKDIDELVNAIHETFEVFCNGDGSSFNDYCLGIFPNRN